MFIASATASVHSKVLRNVTVPAVGSLSLCPSFTQGSLRVVVEVSSSSFYLFARSPSLPSPPLLLGRRLCSICCPPHLMFSPLLIHSVDGKGTSQVCVDGKGTSCWSSLLLPICTVSVLIGLLPCAGNCWVSCGADGEHSDLYIALTAS